MLHIATVHWQNEAWIDIQLRHLRRHISAPYRVYAFLNGIPEANRSKFFYASSDPIKEHAKKLNLLAKVIAASSAHDDLIMFLDGDAFPVGDVMKVVDEGLSSHPLVAVQRLENKGDRQPHPCFCATTVGFWKSIGGDWSEGHTWHDAAGNPVTDVGGNLLGILDKKGVKWRPLHRTNRTNLHPLWFGVYGGVVYHHGAGFRQDKLSRADLAALEANHAREPTLKRAGYQVLDYILRRSPIRALRTLTRQQRASRRNELLCDGVLGSIRNDDQFFRTLLD
jgi:hypothetical protein